MSEWYLAFVSIENLIKVNIIMSIRNAFEVLEDSVNMFTLYLI